MRHALLASCATLLSIPCYAQRAVELPTSGTNVSGTSGANAGGANNSPATNLGGAARTPGLGLSPTLGGPGVTPTPTPQGMSPTGAVPVGVIPISPLNTTPAPFKNVPPTAVSPTAVKPLSVPAAKPQTGAGPAIAPASGGGATASKVLDTAVKDIAKGQEAEALGSGDGLSVRRALDRAYDSSTRAGDVANAPSGRSVNSGKRAATSLASAPNASRKAP